MKIRGRKLTALLLALCIALSLAACGSGGDDTKNNAEQLSGTVYVPQFLDLDVNFDYIEGGCCDGQNAYIVASVSTEEEVTDPDTGETYTQYNYTEGIYRVNLETGEMAELEDYEPSYSFDSNEDGWFSVDGIRLGADGSVWISERAYVYEYDLPDDFNEETDSKWEYQTSTEVRLMRKLDSTGKEIDRLDTSGIQEKLGDWNYISSTVVDAENNLYICGYGGEEYSPKIAVMDKDSNLLFSMDNNSWGEFILLNDGSVAMRRNNADGDTVLSVLDLEAKDWGSTEYQLPYAANNIYNGAGKYLYYYNSGENLYGYNAETEEGEKLLSWSSADINMERLVFFSFLPDGRVAAMTQDWGENGQTIELAVLTETDRSELPEKVTLTYATMGLGSDMRSSIIKFNKASDKYRIEIVDYSEYATEDDYQAGLTKLNTEILAGNVPDILAVSNLPMRQYESKGLLEDLWPFIDNDPDISRDSLMMRVFEAAENDGRLYKVFENFGITTVVGSRKVVGDEMGWTLAELKAALATMPEGCAIFGQSDTKDNMLRYILSMNADNYVNWDTGECFFDSDNFKAALEFCDSFPLEFDWDDPNLEYEDDPSRIAAGRQMLAEVGLNDFGDFQMYEVMFAGEEGTRTLTTNYDYGTGSYSVVVSAGSSSNGGMASASGYSETQTEIKPGRYVTFKGFPMEDGSIGSAFTLGTSMAMSSTCKDKEGAWSFIRELLLPEEERNYYDSYAYRFPSNKVDFDAKVEEAMKVEYMTDSEGKQLLDSDGEPVQESKGGWGWGGLNVKIVATTQEEYEQFMELYNAIDSISTYENSIYDIISEQAGSYFNGDRSLDETASLIQGRVQLYINENR